MFIGHFALGLGAKSVAPRVSLGTLFLSAQFVDLLWPTLLLAGVEHVEIAPGITRVTPLDFVHYPISHSLFMALVWGALFTALYWLLQRSRPDALVVGLLVASHWVLDVLVHRPDLPLSIGGPEKLGMGLWNNFYGTIVLESLLFAVGVWMYQRTTTASNKAGSWGFWGLLVFLVAIYAGNLWGPPPPSVQAIAIAGHAQWLIVLWAYWIDNNRTVRRNAPPEGETVVVSSTT